MATEIAMLHDVSKCTACRGCSVACKQWKNLPDELTPFTGEYQSHKDLSPKTYTLIRMHETYHNNKVGWDFLKFQCMHCNVQGCTASCPEFAITKLENGPVVIDKDKCVGCGYCETNCPFSVPHVDPITKKATKCDLCYDRIENGMMPACALTCTSDAILFGSRDEMTAIAEARLKVLKTKYPNAQLYGVDKKSSKINGTTMMYILTDTPDVFGLPVDPKLSPSIKVWKGAVQPAGKILIVVALVTILGAFVANLFKRKKSADHGKGVDHE